MNGKTATLLRQVALTMEPKPRLGRINPKTKERNEIPQDRKDLLGRLKAQWYGASPRERAKLRRRHKHTVLLARQVEEASE